mmetsp:Transcript_92232/g.257695  ORF Transcript_92232/g.257695 Transcript_92232/m.257695 type:complete len:334 (-) Transcript_92232:445-1446(-)
MVQHSLGQEPARGEAPASVHNRDPPAGAGQVEGVLHGGVAAADHGAGPVSEQVAVAGRAAGHAVAAVLVLALGPQPPAVRPRGDYDRGRPDQAGLVRHDLEGGRCGVQADDGVVPDLGEEAASLALHHLDHFAAVLARHAWVVLHVDTLGHQLAAQAGRYDEGAQVRPCGVYRGSHARRSTSDDDNLLHRPLRPVTVQAARVVGQPPLLLLQVLHSSLLFTALQLVPQILEGSCRQIWLPAFGILLLLLGALLLFRLLVALGLLRLWSIAVLLFQKPHHGREVLLVLFHDLIEALGSGLSRVVLLVELLEGLPRHLDVVPLRLLDQPPRPLPQ